VTEAAPAPTRRRYDNTLRRERAAQTRDRIVAAGAELLQDSSIRDWHAITIRGVAERAGVNERTVFRHFANERALRDAVMRRLEERSGIELTDLRLQDIGDATVAILEQVASHPLDARPALDPTLADANRRLHEALLGAVEDAAGDWSSADRTLAAAMFDVLWAVSSYERLVGDWQLDHDEATRAITWVIGIIEQSIVDGRRPPRRKPAASRKRRASGAG
jgi:AcrR family transcriptional regulator